MADSNNRRINKLQTVKKIETAEEKSANRLKVFGQNLQYIAKYGMPTLTAELGLIVFSIL